MPSRYDAIARRAEPTAIHYNYEASFFVAADLLWLFEARHEMRRLERVGGRRGGVNRALNRHPLSRVDDLVFKRFKFGEEWSHDIPIFFLDMQALLDVVDMMLWKIFGNVDCEEDRLHPRWLTEVKLLYSTCRIRAFVLAWYVQRPTFINEFESLGVQLDENRAVVSMNFVFDVRCYMDELAHEMVSEGIVMQCLRDSSSSPEDDDDEEEEEEGEKDEEKLMYRHSTLTEEEIAKLRELRRIVYSRYVSLLDLDALLDRYKSFASKRACTLADTHVYARRLKRDPYDAQHKHDDVMFRKNELMLERMHASEALREFLIRRAASDFKFPPPMKPSSAPIKKRDDDDEDEEEEKEKIEEDVPVRFLWFDDFLFELALADAARLHTAPVPVTWRRSRLFNGFVSTTPPPLDEEHLLPIMYSTLSELLVQHNLMSSEWSCWSGHNDDAAAAAAVGM